MVFDFPKERFALLLAGRTVSMLLAEIAMAPSASASGPSDIHSQAEVVVCMLFTGEVEERRLGKYCSAPDGIMLSVGAGSSFFVSWHRHMSGCRSERFQ